MFLSAKCLMFLSVFGQFLKFLLYSLNVSLGVFVKCFLPCIRFILCFILLLRWCFSVYYFNVTRVNVHSLGAQTMCINMTVQYCARRTSHVLLSARWCNVTCSYQNRNICVIDNVYFVSVRTKYKHVCLRQWETSQYNIFTFMRASFVYVFENIKCIRLITEICSCPWDPTFLFCLYMYVSTLRLRVYLYCLFPFELCMECLCPYVSWFQWEITMPDDKLKISL
jgi:hypothetical protein